VATLDGRERERERERERGGCKKWVKQNNLKR